MTGYFGTARGAVEHCRELKEGHRAGRWIAPNNPGDTG
jgi:hypothetical protein